MKEHWKDIKEYEGLYQVSDWGNVRSLNYNHTGKTQLLKPAKDNHGYLLVLLCKDGKVRWKMVHRLVAEAFVTNPNTDEYKEVNHKSECPVLNFACVLEYTTHKENCNYGTRNQRIADTLSKPIDQFDKNGNFIRRWKSAKEASIQLGIYHQNISSCARGGGRQKTAGGYVWKFAES